jgi:hypothetical protein
MFACSYGVAFGALQQLPQILPGVDTVRERMAGASAGKAEAEAQIAAGRTRQVITANYTKSQELGGLFGRFALAMIVVYFVSRRALLHTFLLPGMVIIPLAFWGFYRGHETVYWTGDMSWLPGFHNISLSLLGIGIFLAGFFTTSVFSFWGNYLPHVFPVHLRGTGESFAANIGGRMLGTPFAYVTQVIATMEFIPGATPAAKIAIVAAGVAFVLIFVNFLLSFLLPEPEAGAISE